VVDSPNFINKFCKGRVMCNLNSKIVSYQFSFSNSEKYRPCFNYICSLDWYNYKGWLGSKCKT